LKKFITLGLLFISAAANAVTYNLTQLSTLGADSKALGLNDNGQVVGQSYNSSTSQLESVIWNNGVIQSLGVTGIARAVNNSGTVVGETGSASLALPDGYAYSWTSGSGIANLGTLGGLYSGAFDINEAGVITGVAWPTGAIGSTFSHGFIYEDDEMSDLGTVSTPDGYARGEGMNDAGEIVGRASLTDFCCSDKHLSYWEADGTLNSYVGPGTISSGNDINNNGLIVGYARKAGSSNDRFAVSWDTDGNISFLSDLGGNDSRAWAVNDDGTIVGSARDGTSGATNRAAVSYDGTNFIDLNTLVNLTGTDFVKLDQARDINEDGQIVGIGTLADGTTRAFVLTAVPIPAAAWLFASGLGVLGWLRRSRNRGAEISI
jgi:probable HAF family extracellular repeat protein